MASQDLVPWSTGICDCCDDVGNCCMTCFCPCVTFGRVAEIVDQGQPSCCLSGSLYALLMLFTAHPFFYPCLYRTKMRGQYSLEGNICSDCFVHCFCWHLALCQQYRELEHRGFDMKKGWRGNIEKGRGMTAAPSVPGGMSR